ncbi:MAG: hypothetical protein QME21_13450 [Anaerolineales bacterium]|nr:hypothetical protein [Anaerolineales bacterium]
MDALKRCWLCSPRHRFPTDASGYKARFKRAGSRRSRLYVPSGGAFQSLPSRQITTFERSPADGAAGNYPQGYSSSNPNGHKWLPKENWLADFCKLEKQQGRKVLVYVRQSGTRDIQDRVMLPLQANELRVSIFGGNIDPRKREEWIAKRVNTTDVLICNPRLVETGLDLVQFSTVVFFEIE